MYKLNLMLTLIVTFFLISCNGQGNNILDSAPAGTFLYTSYDSTGKEIVKGWFSMDFTDSSIISGEWHFSEIDHPKNIGPQVGSGELIGGLTEDKIWIELNPEFRDNNLQLLGIMDKDSYSGQWTWISFRGPTNYGTFKAIKNY